MRTKTLLLTAAVFAAGLGASMAQVYSVNAVGYVNFPINKVGGGFAIIANPLNGTNNQLNTILRTVPPDSLLFRFQNGGFVDAESWDGSGWLDGQGNPSTTVLAPGEGAFIYVPAATTITWVGDVPQGNLVNPIPNGYSIRASQVPQSAPLNGPNGLNFPAAPDDLLFFWDIAAQGYKDAISWDGTQWLDGFGNPTNPTPAVGEGFFVLKQGAASWNRTFTVN